MLLRRGEPGSCWSWPQKDMRYSELRKSIMGFIERRRDTFGGARPMDFDHYETDDTDPYTTWWGGAGYSGWAGVPWSQGEEVEDLTDEANPELPQMQCQWGKGCKGN